MTPTHVGLAGEAKGAEADSAVGEQLCAEDSRSALYILLCSDGLFGAQPPPVTSLSPHWRGAPTPPSRVAMWESLDSGVEVNPGWG